MFSVIESVPSGSENIYSSYEELFAKLQSRMQGEGYRVVKARSHRGKIGGAEVPGNEMVRCDLVCDRGGRPYKCLATKHKTSTKKTDCPWKAKAVNRKVLGGWVLTIICGEHNHQPGTPEPPSPIHIDDHDADGEPEDNGVISSQAFSATPTVPMNFADAITPTLPDATDMMMTGTPDINPQAAVMASMGIVSKEIETSAALGIAPGLNWPVTKLTGETFSALKTQVRKLSKAERLNVLAQIQLRIAAIYAIESEDIQRAQRQEEAEIRHHQKQAAEQNRQPNVSTAAPAALMTPSNSGQNTFSPHQLRQAQSLQQQAQTMQTHQTSAQAQNLQHQQSMRAAQAQLHAQAQAQVQALSQNQAHMQLQTLHQQSQQQAIHQMSPEFLQHQFQVTVPQQVQQQVQQQNSAGPPVTSNQIPQAQFHQYSGPNRRIRSGNSRRN